MSATTAPPPGAERPAEKAVYRAVPFEQVPGWARDDLTAAWPAWLQSCAGLARRNEWTAVCRAAREVPASQPAAIRSFFESQFNVWAVSSSGGPQADRPADTGLLTGYYEPLLKGSRQKSTRFAVPLYKVPEDLVSVDLGSVYPELRNMRLRGRLVGNKLLPYPSRADIDAGLLSGRELVWVDDPIEAFFLQVQGSGRIQLSDGSLMRVGYADQNGHPYKSIGRWLVDQGELRLDQASMQGIKAWAEKNPQRLAELLGQNPSYVFFREMPPRPAQEGPLGSLGVPLTPGRSMAIDPRHVPLGAPVFVDTTQPLSREPLQRLMMAQDTGGAIRGVVRGDYFWGFGHAAGEQAGRMRQNLRVWVLLPKGVKPPDGEPATPAGS